MACGVWRVACDVWRVACGVWRSSRGSHLVVVCFVTSERRHSRATASFILMKMPMMRVSSFFFLTCALWLSMTWKASMIRTTLVRGQGMCCTCSYSLESRGQSCCALGSLRELSFVSFWLLLHILFFVGGWGGRHRCASQCVHADVVATNRVYIGE